MAVITALALVTAIALILFSVNPSVDRNERGLRKQQMALEQSDLAQHALICANVQKTANAYRFRSLTPSGAVEPLEHFLQRLEIQAEELRLAWGEECKAAPGFPPVGIQIRRALGQINRIFKAVRPEEPETKETADLSPRSSDKQPSFSPHYIKPSDAGVDENGVPAKLKPKLAPAAPIAPLPNHPHPVPEAEEEIAPAKPEETQPSESPGHATNVAEPSYPERSITPIPLAPTEISIETEIP